MHAYARDATHDLSWGVRHGGQESISGCDKSQLGSFPVSLEPYKGADMAALHSLTSSLGHTTWQSLDPGWWFQGDLFLSNRSLSRSRSNQYKDIAQETRLYLTNTKTLPRFVYKMRTSWSV